MFTYNIKLTAEEYSNLQIFLNRVNLQGQEVPAFLNVLKKVAEAEVEVIQTDGK